jgi:hypothetical protein
VSEYFASHLLKISEMEGEYKNGLYRINMGGNRMDSS